MKSVAVIGYGALGKILTSAIVNHLSDDYKVAGIYDIVLKDDFVQVSDIKIHVFSSFEELLNSEADIVVEIAGVEAVKNMASDILREGKDIVITSVGALADDLALKDIVDTAREYDRKVHVTSGAIGGLDIVSTIALMGNAVTSIESRKAPKSLNGAPYLDGVDLPEDEKVLAFEGSARDAILGFPKNTNVAVATGIASTGVNDVNVRVVSDPDVNGNTHCITIENEGAKALIEVTSKPDVKNPKSSVTAAWSVAALLKNLANPIQLF